METNSRLSASTCSRKRENRSMRRRSYPTTRKKRKQQPIILTENDIVDRWARVKQERGLTENADIARFLLTWYLEKSESKSLCSQCQSPLRLFCEKCCNSAVIKPFQGPTTTYIHKAETLAGCTKQGVNSGFKRWSSKHETDSNDSMVNDLNNDGDDAEETRDKKEKHDSEITKTEGYCPFCCLNLKHEEYFSHMANHKDLLALEEGRKFKCRSCQKSFSTFRKLCEHAKLQISEQECLECRQAVMFSCKLKEHKTLHRREVLQYCKWCQRPMVDLTYGTFHKHLQEHRLEDRKSNKKNKNVRNMICSVCGKVFKDKASLTLHLNTVHSEERPFVCEWLGCNHASKTKRDLRTHMAFHGEKREICEQCGMKFHRSVELRLHMQDHFGKKHQCEQCHRRFKKPYELREHVDSVHLGVRRFSCTQPDCGKKFPTKWALTKHVTTVHMDFRPFKCSMCDAARKTKQALQKHMLRHTKDKPYQCADCSQAFACASTFKKHRTTKHSDRVYVCKVCGLTFPIPRNLNFHIRMCHNEVAFDVEKDVVTSSVTQNHCASEQLSDDLLMNENLILEKSEYTNTLSHPNAKDVSALSVSMETLQTVQVVVLQQSV